MSSPTTTRPVQQRKPPEPVITPANSATKEPPLRCEHCGGPMERFRQEVYCPDCTRYTVAPVSSRNAA